MENTRALSPEIKALFEKIKIQSAEYAKAFEMIEAERRAFVRLNEQMATLAKLIKDEADNSSQTLRIHAESVISMLKAKLAETLDLNFDLGNVKEFKTQISQMLDDLNNIHSKVSAQSKEMESALKYFKKKSDMELETAVDSMKDKIEKDIQAEGQKVDSKVSLRQKQIESKLYSLDQTIKNAEDSFTAGIKRLTIEMDLFKNGFRFANDSNKIEEITDFSNDKDKIKILEHKIAEFEDIIAGLAMEANEKLLDKGHTVDHDFSVAISDVEKNAAQISKRISDLTSALENSQKKSSSATAVSVVASILSIIALALILFK